MLRSRFHLCLFDASFFALVFFLAFVFFLPFNVSTIVFSADAYSSGFFNPFESHFFFLSEMFLLLSAFCFFFSKRGVNSCAGFIADCDRRIVLTGSFIVIWAFALTSHHSGLPFAFWLLLRMFEFFYVILFGLSGVLSLRLFLMSFLLSMFGQLILAFIQFGFQSSIGLSLIGESTVSVDSLTTAKNVFLGQTLLRPYGTFVHPNIFAAFVLFAFLLVEFFILDEEKGRCSYAAHSLFRLLVFLLLFLLASRSALLAFALYLLINFEAKSFSIKSFSRKIPQFFTLAILLLVFFSFLALLPRAGIQERLELMGISIRMFFDFPFGVGFGGFTKYIQLFSDSALRPWEFHPVHNVFLLLLNEFGVLCFSLFGFLTVRAFFRKRAELLLGKYYRFFLGLVVVLAVLMSFDHFLFSLYQGQMLLAFFIVLAVLIGRKGLFVTV